MLSRKNWSLILVTLKFKDLEKEGRSYANLSFFLLFVNAKNKTILDRETGKRGRARGSKVPFMNCNSVLINR